VALTPSGVTGAIIAAGPELKGANWFRLASALGVGIVAWSIIPSNLAMTGVTTGAAGGGVVNGKVFVPPQPLPVPATAAAQALLGFVTPSMMRAISMGTALAFNSQAQYQGVSVGVGTGTDVAKVSLANPATLIAALQLSMNGSGMLGFNVPRIALAVGTGIPLLLLTGTGTGVVTGPSGPSPGGGTSLSRVF
jgi:hypothetical protein